MSAYEPTIGIETHAQLLTASKMFCRCEVPPSFHRDSGDRPMVPANSLVCPVCLGMPGSLPVINERAVEYVIMTGLALNCQIAEFSRFDRKNYHYPDLVKGYQISQFHAPLCHDGWIEVGANGKTKRIGISDVHLEEDTGKLVHVPGHSLIDYNRSGIPLMEIVTAPDFGSLEEVREYVVELRRLLCYLGINSGSMEEGAMRFEANISVRSAGATTLGTRVEIKNLNSFKGLLRSVEYEIQRQVQTLREGGAVRRETRGWDDAKAVTYAQRSKEMADDYRYFPEPDLPPLEIKREWVQRIRAQMPELPGERRQRLMSLYQLSAYDVGLLTEDRFIADYFERAAEAARGRGTVPPLVGRGIEPKTVANWITGELFRLLRAEEPGAEAIPVLPEQLAGLLELLNLGKINVTTAKHVLEIMFRTGRTADEIVSEEGLILITDRDHLAAVVQEVIAANPQAVAQYKAGKETVLRFLVGQVMKATKGKAEPGMAADLLKAGLGSV